MIGVECDAGARGAVAERPQPRSGNPLAVLRSEAAPSSQETSHEPTQVDGPALRPRDPEPRHRVSAFDPRRRELTMMTTPRARSDSPAALPKPSLGRVTEYIQQNLDKDLTLAELASVVYMSPYHFSRRFKRSTGVPPHRFVIRERIARASVVLTRPELSIAQISRMVGFGTPSHFTTVFRRATGITPKGYRTGYLREGQLSR